jgi:2-polyprenyl-3-methyl-5-hydroxy-6-metoxy-1,4-benzoquinol methylase
MSKLTAPYSNDIRCCVCSNTNVADFTIIHQFDTFAVVNCDVCSFKFIPPYYRSEIVYTQYKDSKVTEAIRSGNDWIKIERHKLRFDFIKKYVKKGKLFDLGAGWGHFLLAAQELGYEASGIEMSEQQYQYCVNDKHLKVEHGDFFLMDESQKYDVVTMWDVLEHIDRADVCIEKCARITNTGGYIFILIPQSDSFIASMMKRNWKMMGLDHVNYFNKKTITQLLGKYGYEVQEIRSSFELKLFVMYTVLPWIKRLKKRKKESLRETNSTISSAERQVYFNKFTSRPKWQLKLMMSAYALMYKTLSTFRIGDEMVIAAKKVR